MGLHLPSFLTRRNDSLHVITMVQNPLRWTSRERNYRIFAEGVKRGGAKLYTVEVQHSDRPFRLTKWWRFRRHLRLRTDQELWQKEAAINAMIKRLPRRARYVAWIDADILFARPDWARETVQQLKHYAVVQMFTHAYDLDAEFRPLSGDPVFSFGYSHVAGFPRIPSPGPLPSTYAEAKLKGVYWHPGFAWAARREFLDRVGGLIDIGIIGAGDWLMANSLIGEPDRAIPKNYHENYKRIVHEWAERAAAFAHDLGYVDGTIFHLWHGRKIDRQYQKRTPILDATLFDPDRDLSRDKQGLWVLRFSAYEIRDMIRRINRARREDG